MTLRRRRQNDWASALTAGHPGGLLREPEEVASPVLRVILDRARAGSRPGERDDEHVVCLAVEGGGMRGAVSAGMCVMLEAAGLVAAFDRIYGVSAGALNGWATAVGQAALSATHYQDAANRRVINRMRPLLGRPVIDYELLFKELIATRKPLSFERLSQGPEFRALATSLETLSLRVLAGFVDRRRPPASRLGERRVAPPGWAPTRVPGRADGRRWPHRADPVRDRGGRGRDPRARAPHAPGRVPKAGAPRSGPSRSPCGTNPRCSSRSGPVTACTTAMRPRSPTHTPRASAAPTALTYCRSPSRTGRA